MGTPSPGLQPLTRATLARHRTTVPGTQDEIYAPLYDSATYPAAGTNQITFFTAPIGSGATSAPGAAGTKTEADTNIQVAGMLPRGNRFLVTGIEFQFFPGSNPGRGPAADNTIGFNWNDVYTWAKAGWVRFRVQNRDYLLDGPLLNFPPVARIAGVASATSTLTAGAATLDQIEYATVAGIPYNLVGVYIEATQAFAVIVNYPALVALPSAAAARVFCRLRGRFVRDAQ